MLKVLKILKWLTPKYYLNPSTLFTTAKEYNYYLLTKITSISSWINYNTRAGDITKCENPNCMIGQICYGEAYILLTLQSYTLTYRRFGHTYSKAKKRWGIEHIFCSECACSPDVGGQDISSMYKKAILKNYPNTVFYRPNFGILGDFITYRENKLKTHEDHIEEEKQTLIARLP